MDFQPLSRNLITSFSCIPVAVGAKKMKFDAKSVKELGSSFNATTHLEMQNQEMREIKKLNQLTKQT